MALREFKTEQRISNIMRDNNRFSYDDIKKVYCAFDKLIVLKKGFSESIIRMNQQTFELEREEYAEKMQWINDFMKSKGIEDNIFSDISNFINSSDDYDYYYEFKTPTQYRKEEEERKAKVSGTKGDGEQIDK